MFLHSFLSRFMARACVLTGVGLFLLVSLAQARTTYYIDPVGGNDANAGTSQTAAWKTLEKMNVCFPACVTFVPGDTIRLKAGTIFERSQIWPRGVGTKTNPIVVDRYGTGANPHIKCHLGHTEPAGSTGQANGKDNGAAILFRCEGKNWSQPQGGWEINNLEITNPDGMGGIKVLGKNGPESAQYFHFNNLKIHNIPAVNAIDDAPLMGGIVFKISDALVNDVLINNCEIYDIGVSGIQTAFWDLSVNSTPRITNFVIRNTKVYNCGQYGIIMRTADRVLIDKCTIYNTGLKKNGESFGVRLKYSIGSKIQYCEAYNNTDNGTGGHAFSLDGQAVACTLQYNYSHDNDGGFAAVISDPNEISKDNVIRYNVSQNDRKMSFFLEGGAINTSVYNNTIYVSSATTFSKVVQSSSGSSGNTFKNNIFYINKSATYDPTGATWDNNCFFGTNTNQPTDAHKLVADPKFKSAGSGSIGRSTANGYILDATSPCINAGLLIPNAGSKDFWGDPTPHNGKMNIGAYEGTDGTVVNPTSNLPPTCSIASPVSSATFTAPANIVVTVNAADADGSVSKVSLYKNDVLIRDESGAPYEWNNTSQDAALKNLAAGTYTLKAVATDDQGATTTSTITITVGSASPIMIHANSIRANDIGESQVKIINLRGQVVRTETLLGNRQLNLDGISHGVYHVIKQSVRGTESTMLVK